VIAGLTVDFIAILVGAIGTLFVLVLLFGRQAPVVPYAEPFDAADDGATATDDADGLFVRMPEHLRTHAEMVAWMTQELPRLTEGVTTKPRRN